MKDSHLALSVISRCAFRRSFHFSDILLVLENLVGDNDVMRSVKFPYTFICLGATDLIRYMYECRCALVVKQLRSIGNLFRRVFCDAELYG